MKKNKVYNLGIGTTSILIIFIVVCLTILSVLSYMVTNTDGKVTNTKVDYNSLYYKADGQAVDKMAQIDDMLYKIASNNMKFNDVDAKMLLAKIDGIYVDYSENEIHYDVLVKNSTYISVVLNVNVDKKFKLPKVKKNKFNKKEKGESRLEIKKWQLVNKGEEIEETIANLWTNE